ncbi:hypothetical protein CTAYLR_005630 [Chrysophaeum taylorii]|uniref:Sulfotransferase n=1 Tax=Chrysophaeum taylorii TaxID=2483200 RepID=A0AAD7XUI1_9STRA|nr:hypothetical protein CTAYLR_005630 [Chrysophaeum taylorii]
MLVVSMAAVARQRALCVETGCWPAAWILGCPKCASTSVWLLLHDSLGFCGAELAGLLEGEAEWHEKETHFWSGRGVVNTSMVPVIGELFTELYPVRKVGDSCASFVEGTPDNLRTIDAATLLKKSAPPSVSGLFRFVVVLREPIARDLSWYNHVRRASRKLLREHECNVSVSYEEYARCHAEKFEATFPRSQEKGLWGGVYKLQLDLWTRWFDRSQILVFDFASLVVYNTTTYIRTLASFLGVDDDHIIPATIPHRNVVGAGDNQQRTIDCETRDLLEGIFAPWNEQLYALLDQDHRAKRAWVGEPPFRPFDPMPCHHHY